MTFRILRLAAACVALSRLTACSGGAGNGAARHAWTQPGTLRIAVSTEPNSLNPIFPANTLENFLTGLCFDPLVSVDAQRRHVPILASVVPSVQNGGISRDGLRVSYKLRRDVRWQDGAPFTSRDVRFTFDAIVNPRNNVASRRGYELVTRVSTPGPYSITFILRRPFAPAIDTLFAESDEPYRVLPAHLLERLRDLNAAPFNAHPIGTGAFRVVRWLRGDRIELAANDRYFLGRPRLRRIVVRFVPNENTMALQLRSHEIDWAFEAAATTYPQLRALPDATTVLTPANQWFGLFLNTTRAPLDDVRVRRAIALAIDKPALVRDATFDTGSVATGDLPATLFSSRVAGPRAAFDPQAARRLLAAAGWSVRGDGIATRNGRRLSLSLAFGQGLATSQRIAVALQSSLRASGIDLQLKSYPVSLVWEAAAAGGILEGGKFDAYLGSWLAGVDPDNSGQFTCAQRAPAGNDVTRYCTPEMEAAQRVALRTLDPELRERAYARIEALIARDVPIVPIYWQPQVQAFDRDFHGFAPNPVTESWNAYRWSI